MPGMPNRLNPNANLKLDELGDGREAHLVKLIKSFLSGKCHPAMPSMV